MKYPLFFFISVVLAGCGAQPPTPVESQTVQIKGPTGAFLDSTLTPYVQQLLKLTDNPSGLAIGITKGEDIVYARTFGYANVEKKIPADFHSVFHIASVSKPFTAVAVAKLVQEKKLRLEDRIVDYIPEFEMKGTGYEKITIQHILTHTSGIPRHVSSDDWLNPIEGPKALEENLQNVRDFELEFEPGTKFNYSNSAFDILGIVIARVSGVPFTTYIEDHILAAAGMQSSVYRKPKDLPSNWAVPYSYGLETQEWAPYPYTGKYAPSSGLQSTLLDMCRWGLIHLGKGRYQEHQVLDETHFDLLVSPHYDTPWGDKIGLSWFLQSYLDRPNIMHLGNDTGFETNLYIYPEDTISIVVMANRDFSRVGRISLAAAELLFGEDPKSYTLSARYKFTEAFKSTGMESAKKVWETLRQDTTDIYYVEDDDILTAGAVLENAGKWRQTKEVLEYYTRLNDQSTYAWRLLGNAAAGLGDTLGAMAHYEQALKINPNYERAKTAIAKLSKAKDKRPMDE
ncbi:MAG: serine hydrolase [Bacteroidota bacterium]